MGNTTIITNKPQQSLKRDDGEFVVFEAVAFFKEHTNRDGVRIDRAALQRICDRCNERIQDTGDFPPVVLRHTTDEGDRDPEVVGFAGPFFLGSVGNLRPKAAIFGQMRIFADDAAKARKYPRLSVEYWASEDDPTNGYFDPISLLGAETPELDLGIRYQRGRKGQRLLRYARIERMNYQAASPGGSNTFVPGGSNIDKPKDQKDQYAKETSGMLSEDDIKQIVAAMQPVIEAVVEDRVMALKEPDGDEDPEADTEVDPGDATPDANLDADATDAAVADDKPAATPSEVRPAADEDADKGDVPSPDEKKDKYQADATGGDETVTRYKKERDEYHAKYQKEVTAHRQTAQQYEKLKADTAGLQAEKQRAVRYQKLGELQGQGYTLDLDEEVKDCEAMDDDAFGRHCDRIVNRYQRVPLNVTLPQQQPKKNDGSTAEEKRARYAKQAGENVLAARKNGQKLEFKTELERLVAADGAA